MLATRITREPKFMAIAISPDFLIVPEHGCTRMSEHVQNRYEIRVFLLELSIVPFHSKRIIP